MTGDLFQSQTRHPSPPGWDGAIYAVVAFVCRTKARWTSDDILAAAREKGVDHGRIDLRALGPVLKRAEKNGLCRKTRDHRPSRRRHASPVTIWESL